MINQNQTPSPSHSAIVSREETSLTDSKTVMMVNLHSMGSGMSLRLREANGLLMSCSLRELRLGCGSKDIEGLRTPRGTSGAAGPGAVSADSPETLSSCAAELQCVTGGLSCQDDTPEEVLPQPLKVQSV